MKTMLLAAGAIASLALAAPAGAAITLNYIVVSSSADANAFSGSKAQYSYADDGANSGVVPLAALTADATAEAKVRRDHTLKAEGHAEESATASFTDAASGVFSFFGHTSADAYDDDADATGRTNGASVDYLFSTDRDGRLRVNYTQSQSNPVDGSQTELDIFDFTTNSLTIHPFAFNTSGMYSFDLMAGHSYQFSLSANSYTDLADSSAFASRHAEGSHSETFDWAIGGVPEPDSWALMLLGFGGIGAMVRRRRSGPALA